MTGEKTARMSSVLGPSAVVIGNVQGSGDFEVRGRVQGSIALSGRVHIADGGVVLGDIEATHVSVAGEVRGQVLAQDGVLVASSGRVEGDIAAPRVGIEAGARVQGHVRAGGELADRGELLPQVAPHVSASTFVSLASAPLPLAATVPFKAPAPRAPVPAQAITPPGAASATPPSQPSVPPPSIASPHVNPRQAAGPSEPASNRPRKRKRPRSPFAAPGGSATAAPPAPPQEASHNTHKMEVAVPAPRTASTAQSKARAARPRPQGPPVVPTFENGAKPRSR